MQCAPTSLGLVASLPWWHPSTSALPWHGSILGGFDSKRRVNEDERGCTWDGPPPSMPRRLWVLPVLGPMLSLTSCRRLFGGSIQDHQPRVGSACLAHHPTSGSYRLNKGLGAGLATIALAGVGAGVGIVFGSLIHSVSRNPTLSKQLFGYAILGFALSEAMALFALLVAYTAVCPLSLWRWVPMRVGFTPFDGGRCAFGLPIQDVDPAL